MTQETTLDDATEQCSECHETVLAAYIEDGRCPDCQE